jgi:prepilin-type N-terminal cleavage/methylation domain-containing protein
MPGHRRGTLVFHARGRSGFTIIELMLTVGIVGLLATLAIPTMMRFQLKAKAAEGRVNIAAIRESEEAYFAEWGVYVSAVPVLPLSIGPSRAPWVLTATDPHGFNDIGWSPVGSLYFQYGVKASGGLAYTIEARSDIDGDGTYNSWGYVKPIIGTSVGIAGPMGLCPATGVFDPDNRAPNRLNLIGPCNVQSGVTAY